ncbi:MAG: 6,7-dimethyl-8-ribityllumazine synthase [Hyphomicrobiales bacterium]|nr:6,7-dimethyl-8-ribityllumazine synthase [Hyphomicrobiales bacterium]MBV8763311.1 6,7-dimethyl-8-ribityllumazine synthase [Hyphomicrobiales bacterium]MBV9432240.1 6,7-dimethyl-8-ribityllumazine synthase [Hyphomicrobiales bacterium]
MKREPRPGIQKGSRLEGARCLIVEARFYPHIADGLLKGALATFARSGVHCDVLTVPGALEIPAALVIALDAARDRGEPYEAAVALGCVIRGETSHYDIVAGESARALMQISVARGLPLGNGILTVDTEDQALERADAGRLDKGGGAAEAALAVLAIKRAAPARNAR